MRRPGGHTAWPLAYCRVLVANAVAQAVILDPSHSFIPLGSLDRIAGPLAERLSDVGRRVEPSSGRSGALLAGEQMIDHGVLNTSAWIIAVGGSQLVAAGHQL